jgi:predicted small secreted protein
MRRLTLIAATFAAVLLAGCNTVRGLGQDIEKGGEALQRAANK